MGNKNNNLEDFLRRKFSEIENSEEAWTKPNLTVRNAVLDEITTPNKKRKKAGLFFLLLLGVLMSVVLFEFFKEEQATAKIDFHTKEIKRAAEVLDNASIKAELSPVTKKMIEDNIERAEATTEFSKDKLLERNTLLRTVIQNQNDIITQLKKENLVAQNNSVENELVKDISLGDESTEKFQNLLEANHQLKIEQTKLEFLNKEQRKEIETLNQEKELLLDRLDAQVLASNSKETYETTTIKNKIAFETIKPLVANKLDEKVVVVEPVTLEEGFGLDQPKKKIEFEVGYQLGFRGRMAEVIEYTEQQGTITNQVKDKFLVSHVHGLNIGISPVKNFWIKTGAHVGNMNLHQKHAIKFIYDANRTSVVTSGAYTEDINDLSRSGISTLETNIGALANAQGAVNGDELDLNFQTNLVLTYLQIPLEFNYLYGKKKLQALFQVGGQWNLLNYQYYMHGFGTKINNQSNMSLTDNVDLPEKSSVQYWGLHAGVGLNYHISKHFVLQGLLSYEYYFQYNGLNPAPSNGNQVHAINYKEASPVSNMGFGLKLGLNYRF